MARTIGWVAPEAESKKNTTEQAEEPAPAVLEAPQAEEKPKKTTKKTTKK